MKLARVQADELARPVLTLVCDGSHYDVARLEQLLGMVGPVSGGDFFARVVSAGCAGLDALAARLHAGPRPAAARLGPEAMLPLPPCDGSRSAYFQLAPHDLASERPGFRQGDARSLVGDGQPVAFPGDVSEPGLEVGLAVVLSDDLWQASAREAERAVLGVTLLLDWTGRTDRWARPTSAPEAPSQVGPFLLVGPLGRRLLDEPLLLRVGTESYRVGAARDGPFRIGEALAYLSQHVALRAGDLVGTGSVHGGRLPATGRPLGYHDRVSVSVPGLATLHGWAVRGPEPVAWRDAHAREEDGRRSQNEP